jgi:hypothetical protein
MKHWFVTLTLLLAMQSAPVWAFEFSAERIVKEGGKYTASSVKAKDDRWRFEYVEPQAGAQVCIVRQDRRSAWLILSPRRVFVEVPITDGHLLYVSEKMEGEIARELIGPGYLHGHETELFEVTVMVNGKPAQFYQWVTTGERFAMKTMSKQGDWWLEYRNVRFAPQWWRYFETPNGFFRTDPSTEQDRVAS